MKEIKKSSKLDNVLYDIRGPIMDKAKQMEAEGRRLIKLNIGNLAVFGFDPPEEVMRDMPERRQWQLEPPTSTTPTQPLRRFRESSLIWKKMELTTSKSYIE